MACPYKIPFKMNALYYGDCPEVMAHPRTGDPYQSDLLKG